MINNDIGGFRPSHVFNVQSISSSVDHRKIPDYTSINIVHKPYMYLIRINF